jgi:hypothetical protein
VTGQITFDGISGSSVAARSRRDAAAIMPLTLER